MAQQPNPAINPNSDKYKVDTIDINLFSSNKQKQGGANPNQGGGKQIEFVKFIKKLKIDNLKHISNLELEFKHPISIISGINRSGKTTILTTIACSHEHFKKKNMTTGVLERHTWQDFMRFTVSDKQLADYKFSITYRMENDTYTKSGTRKLNTKKWSGVAKKEGQIKDGEVRFIDLSRLLPARNFGKSILNRANNNININQKLIICLSHILELQFSIQTQFSYQDKETFAYQNTYSSFNAATGEEVLIKMLKEILEAPQNSIILIDEIEAGLHPKIQRRLMDIIYYIARREKKQFIITSHSPIILSCVPNQSRILLENRNEIYQSYQDCSINFILSKMDSQMYPLIDLCCEDDVAKRVIDKLLEQLIDIDDSYRNLINIMITGSASNTFNTFTVLHKTYSQRKIRTGYGCVLDADMKEDTKYQNHEPFVYFLFGEYTDKNPEYFLVSEYLGTNPNDNLKYYLEDANNHVLFQKMVEFGIVNSNIDNNLAAFNACWDIFIQNHPDYINAFKAYIDGLITEFKGRNL